jgi:hypothetical protein
MAWSLCTKDDVSNLHPVPVSELRDDWSDMVESLIREHVGQPYLGTQEVIVGEYHNGDGSHIVRVSKPPILSVEAVYVNDSLLTPSDYVVFSGHIALKAQTFPAGILNVKLDYTSGTVSVSPTVKLTAIAMIVAILNYRKRHGADSSIKWGASATDNKMGEENPNMNVGLTSHLYTIMRRTLRRSRVRAR